MVMNVPTNRVFVLFLNEGSQVRGVEAVAAGGSGLGGLLAMGPIRSVGNVPTAKKRLGSLLIIVALLQRMWLVTPPVATEGVESRVRLA